MLKNIKSVLFDLDGTLLDTSEGIINSVKYTIRCLGLRNLSDKVLSCFIGPPIQDSLIKYCCLSRDEAQEGANIFRNYYKSECLYQAYVYEGIIELLLILQKQNLNIGVATYKREDYAINILKHFGIFNYCSVVHGADNDNELTKADIIENVCQELSVEKSSTVLVGDTEFDRIGADISGINFIGVTWGFGYSKSVTYSQNIILVDTPAQLESILYSK